MTKRNPIIKPDVAATKVETVTAAPTPSPATAKQRSSFLGDPMWSARRLRVDATLLTSFGLISVSMYQGQGMASVVVSPALTAIVAILGIYMGVAETGRVFGVMGTSVTTATQVRTSSSVKD